MDREHVTIRKPEFVAGTSERPEVGVFTQTHATRPPVPSGKIAIGETVWMKWSGGPIVARAKVQGFHVFENCSAERLRETTKGFKLYDVDKYWRSRPPSFFSMTIFLKDEEWLAEVIQPAARSHGESWIVLSTTEQKRLWLHPGSAVSVPNRKAGGRSRTIPMSLRFEVFRRDSFTCVYCGRRPPDVILHADHQKSWKEKGPTSLENLVTACSDCNLGKGSRSL